MTERPEFYDIDRIRLESEASCNNAYVVGPMALNESLRRALALIDWQDEQLKAKDERIRELEAELDERTTNMNALGYCPICGAPGKLRERRPFGNDICENGHDYPSAKAGKLVQVHYEHPDGTHEFIAQTLYVQGKLLDSLSEIEKRHPVPKGVTPHLVYEGHPWFALAPTKEPQP